MSKFLTIEQAAKRVGRDERTIRRWVDTVREEGANLMLGGLIREESLLEVERRMRSRRGRPRKVRPEVVVLCGSTRFYETFRLQNLRLTLEGKIVLSIGYDGKSDDDLAAAGLFGVAPDKAALDELHKRKIDMADSVLVLNVGGYVGESTRSEIDYARAEGKPIAFLEAV